MDGTRVMRQSRRIAGRHLSHRDADRALPYARFFNPEMKALQPQAVAALLRGGVAAEMLPPLDHARDDLFGSGPGYEDGYVLLPDGGMRVFIRTDMPGVTPAMIDWWFGWHGDHAAKYKLWHPKAHVHVQWRADPPKGARGRAAYVGHVSIVDEYIGSDFVRGLIQFAPPATLGLEHESLENGSATLIAARLGVYEAPVNAGVLLHHVRAVPGGSEMRSRFYMGGRHIAARNALGTLPAMLARRTLRMRESDARALLVHCAEEMQHLSTFLPALHDGFGEPNLPAS